jgi:hypothetical protein
MFLLFGLLCQNVNFQDQHSLQQWLAVLVPNLDRHVAPVGGWLDLPRIVGQGGEGFYSNGVMTAG